MLLQADLEKKQRDLEELQVDCEKKDEEIEQLNQSLSQMSVDKEEMDQIRAKLTDTEEKLVQANRELQTHAQREGVFCYMRMISTYVESVCFTHYNTDLCHCVSCYFTGNHIN